jgi:hypothetical protein
MNGNFSTDSLEAFARLAGEIVSADFSESEDSYDFTRCVRPDGSAYGTRGQCRKGTESAKEAVQGTAVKPAGGGRRAPADQSGRVAKHEADYNKYAAEHKAAKAELNAHKGRDLAARVKRHQMKNAIQTLEDKRDTAHDKLMQAKRAKFAVEEKAKRQPKGVTPAADLAGQHSAEMGVPRAKLEKVYGKMLAKNPDMDLGDLYMGAQKVLKGKG